MNGLDPTVMEEAAAPSRLEPPKSPEDTAQSQEEAAQKLLVDSLMGLQQMSRQYQAKVQDENEENTDAGSASGPYGGSGGAEHD